MHGGAGFLDFVQQNFGAAQGQLLFILADGRQAGNAVLSESDAVIARNGDILRDAQTVILQARMAPKAIRSDMANTAVISGAVSNRCSIAL